MSEGTQFENQPAALQPLKPVSIVIPVYNQVEFTRTCLIALSQHTPGSLYELIVVDNASIDGTQALLASVSGNLQVIRNDRNLGFAKACNQGAYLARGEHLVFLNNDTAPFPGWLEALLRELEAPDVGVVGSKLLYPQTGLVQHAGMATVVEATLPVHLFRHMDAKLPPLDEPRDFEMVTGACLLIRRVLFERLGGFDEGYLNGFEDVDLCLRVREAGYRVRYAPESVVYHCEGTSEGRFDHNQANYLRFQARWQGRFGKGGHLRQARPPEVPSSAELAIHAPLFALNACGEEARALVAQLGINMTVCDTGPHSAILQQQLSPAEASALDRASRQAITHARIRLHIGPLEMIARQGNGYQIARTSFPTQELPQALVTRCNELDEIWVPTDAHAMACERAGVRTRVVKVPLGVDTKRFRPGLSPLPLPVKGPTIFLGVGEWNSRKGWDLLLEAWARAFSATDEVCLLLRVHPQGQTDNPYLGPEIQADIDRFMQAQSLNRRQLAPIVLLPEQLAAAAMPHLYAAAHAFVAPGHGSSWNRSALEAMACGLPVIASSRREAEYAASVTSNGSAFSRSHEDPFDQSGLRRIYALNRVVGRLRQVASDPSMAAERIQARETALAHADLGASLAIMRTRLRELGGD